MRSYTHGNNNIRNNSYTRKNPGIAIVLGLLGGVVGICGLGTIYAKRIINGFGFLIFGAILYALFTYYLSKINVYAMNDIQIAFFEILVISYFFLYIIQIINGYNDTKRYNRNLLKTGDLSW